MAEEKSKKLEHPKERSQNKKNIQRLDMDHLILVKYDILLDYIFLIRQFLNTLKITEKV